MKYFITILTAIIPGFLSIIINQAHVAFVIMIVAILYGFYRMDKAEFAFEKYSNLWMIIQIINAYLVCTYYLYGV
jgi:hypothetical protein